jgi:hypothetical protein
MITHRSDSSSNNTDHTVSVGGREEVAGELTPVPKAIDPQATIRVDHELNHLRIDQVLERL